MVRLSPRFPPWSGSGFVAFVAFPFISGMCSSSTRERFVAIALGVGFVLFRGLFFLWVYLKNRNRKMPAANSNCCQYRYWIRVSKQSYTTRVNIEVGGEESSVQGAKLNWELLPNEIKLSRCRRREVVLLLGGKLLKQEYTANRLTWVMEFLAKPVTSTEWKHRIVCIRKDLINPPTADKYPSREILNTVKRGNFDSTCGSANNCLFHSYY